MIEVARVQVRQWIALLVVARREGEPTPVTEIDKALNDYCPGNHAYGVIMSLRAKGLLRCATQASPHRCDRTCHVVLTDAGWDARPSGTAHKRIELRR